jgi:hypothetical protein
MGEANKPQWRMGGQRNGPGLMIALCSHDQFHLRLNGKFT